MEAEPNKLNIQKTPVKELVINNQLIEASKLQIFGDDRGYFCSISFEQDSKRAYFIQNHSKGTVRAFHGHKKENKTFYVLRGAFKLIIIDMASGNWKSFTLTEKGNNMLKIPSMVYNGFVSLTTDSEMLVVSNSTMDESRNDDIRIPYDFLGKEVWKVEHR